MYLKLDEITTLQFDHTSRCNCMCPQCGRVGADWNVLPSLPITDLTLDDYKLILEPFHGRPYNIIHCGNFGDALVSPTFDETFDYCLQSTVNNIKIMTNGSMRTPKWWTELAEKSAGRLAVIFSIDGLKDTNHIYRIGSNFDKIIENATAFINAGGNATWVFIRFDHNYHQVNEALELATSLGFKKFVVKTSARFVDQNISEIKNKNNSIVVDIPSHHQTDKQKIIEEYGSFENYVNKTPIVCKYIQLKAVFVDLCMRVWPCCWLGMFPYVDQFDDQAASSAHLTKLYGHEFNNLRKFGWDVLEHEFFKEYLHNSWTCPTETHKRIWSCGRTCGETFKFSGGDEANLTISQLQGKI